ncbi:MAG: hypothetical protein CMJ83_15330, partial [Planctomycetes bacterium]|nr:hypothetical protein [Planctomycetota bacterium]
MERGWDVPDAEAAKTVDLLLPLFGRAGQPDELLRLRYLMGGDDLSRLLARFPPPPRSLTAREILGQTHRQMRAEHIPLLAALTRRKNDPELVDEARDAITFLCAYTDRFREDVAAAVLESMGAPRIPLVPGSGLPPSLASTLAAFYVGTESMTRRDRGSSVDHVGGWQLRWLAESHPRSADVPLLLKVGRACTANEWTLDLSIVIDRLGRVPDNRAAAWIASLDGAALEVTPVVLAARARQGDARAAGELRASALQTGTALACLYDLDPANARKLVLRALATRATPELVEVVRDAVWSAGQVGLMPFDLDAAAVLAASGKTADGAVLAALGCATRGCRSRRLAQQALVRGAKAPYEMLDLEIEIHAFLESAAPDAWRALLRPQLSSKDPDRRTCAASLLLRAGDVAAGQELAHLLDDGLDVDRRTSLARSAGPEVLAWLRHRAAREGENVELWLVTLAVAAGWPEAAAGQLWSLLDEKTVKTLRKVILSGARNDVVPRLLALFPDERFDDISRVRRPEVARYLERLRRRFPSNGTYAWATGELARMGDPKALAEVTSVIVNGRKQWVDEAPVEHLTLDCDPAFIRLQIEPPRDSRRLHSLRGWSDGKTKQVFPRGEGASRSDGRGA